MKLGNPFGKGKELWVDVDGYLGCYKVSNFGRVKNIRTNKILTNSLTKKGYFRVNLWKNNKYKTCAIHRLVLSAFQPNKQNKRTVNHRDGNPKNNNVGNLEWATDYENVHHAMDTGLMDYRGEGNPMSKLTRKDVRRIKIGLASGIKQKELADIYGVAEPLISLINSGKRWGHIKLNIIHI